MKINRSMNIVLKYASEARGTIYVYSVPVSREVYNSNFEVLSLTHSRLWDKGTHYAVTESRSVSKLMLKKVAESMGDPKEGGLWPLIDREFINEIARLTSIAVATPNSGYEQMTLTDAVSRELIDAEDRDEIENELVFFTLETYANRRQNLLARWPLLFTSLSFTDYLSSSLTSKPAENSGVAPAASTEAPPERLASVPR